MDNFLNQIRVLKEKQIEAKRAVLPLIELEEQIKELPPAPDFLQSLSRRANQPLSLIAEIKVGSPGKRNVDTLDLETVVSDYAKGGVSAISVLTDEFHFGGRLETLGQVRALCPFPLLHKEFIVDPYQLAEGRLQGSSAALILTHYFDEEPLRQILSQARDYGLSPVVECSLPEELPRALAAEPEVLLINNRPIAALPANPQKTYLTGSLAVSENLWGEWDAVKRWKSGGKRVLISASCIDSRQDVQLLESTPFDAMLVGNAAMTAKDRVQFLRWLIGRAESDMA